MESGRRSACKLLFVKCHSSQCLEESMQGVREGGNALKQASCSAAIVTTAAAIAAKARLEGPELSFENYSLLPD